MKTLAILAAMTVIAAPAFAGDHGHKMDKKTEVKTEVSTTTVSGTVAVSGTAAK